MTIDTICANSGKSIKIELNNDLEIINYNPGSDPMICVPMVNLVNDSEPSIVDIF